MWRLVTGDEKWIFFDNPKKDKSWVFPEETPSKKPKRNIYGKKVLLSVFWDQKGVIFFELLDPGKTINAEKYCEQLEILKDKIHLKRPSLRKNQVVFLQDNARPYTAKKVKELLASFQWDVLKHPPYSLDLAPSDYHLFRSMTHALFEKKFDEGEFLFFP